MPLVLQESVAGLLLLKLTKASCIMQITDTG